MRLDAQGPPPICAPIGDKAGLEGGNETSRHHPGLSLSSLGPGPHGLPSVASAQVGHTQGPATIPSSEGVHSMSTPLTVLTLLGFSVAGVLTHPRIHTPRPRGIHIPHKGKKGLRLADPVPHDSDLA